MKKQNRLKYPTKSQILKCLVVPTKYDIEVTREWKELVWNKNDKEKTKIQNIKVLLITILRHYNRETTIKFNSKIPSARYSQKNDTITLNNHSIITALHELGHAIYGDSELKACSWSIKLFKETFPIAFKKLEWEKHMLKQK